MASRFTHLRCRERSAPIFWILACTAPERLSTDFRGEGVPQLGWEDNQNVVGRKQEGPSQQHCSNQWTS